MVLSPDGIRLFVANANTNTVTVIDTFLRVVTETLHCGIYPDALAGSTPNSLEITPDGKQLYIANADNNCLAVFDISQPGSSKPLGFVPVGWYPTSVRISPDGTKVFVANAKGLSSTSNRHGPNPYWRGQQRRSFEQHIRLMLPGMLSVISLPTEREFADYTARVYATSPYRRDRQPIA